MCPYGLVYNLISALPWPALVGFLQPMLQSLAAKRNQRKAAKATR